MSKVVKPWNDPKGIFRLSARNHRGNNIAKPNVSAIQAYHAIEDIEIAKVRYPGLCLRYLGGVK